MTQKNIKKEVETLTAQISSNQDRLKYLREICKHENGHKDGKAFSPYYDQIAIVCDDCCMTYKFETKSLSDYV